MCVTILLLWSYNLRWAIRPIRAFWNLCTATKNITCKEKNKMNKSRFLEISDYVVNILWNKGLGLNVHYSKIADWVWQYIHPWIHLLQMLFAHLNGEFSIKIFIKVRFFTSIFCIYANDYNVSNYHTLKTQADSAN